MQSLISVTWYRLMPREWQDSISSDIPANCISKLWQRAVTGLEDSRIQINDRFPSVCVQTSHYANTCARIHC